MKVVLDHPYAHPLIELGGHIYRVLSVSDDELTLTVEPYNPTQRIG